MWLSGAPSMPVGLISSPPIHITHSTPSLHSGQPAPVIEHNELCERISLDLTPFQQGFLDLPVPELQRLLLAALYLDIRTLYTLAAYRSSLTLLGKTHEQIRQEWGLPDDLTEEEKQAIRDENPWVREGERRV